MSQERPQFTAPKSNSTTDRPDVPTGMQRATCIAVIDLGDQKTEWKGNIKYQRKIILSFEFPDHLHVFDETKGEQPLVSTAWFTWSFYKESQFKQFVNGWRGRALTVEEEETFDVGRMLGAKAWINIVAKESNGRVYHNIASASAMSKVHAEGMPEQPYNTLIAYHISQGFEGPAFEALHEWQRKKIKESQQYSNYTEYQMAESAKKNAAQNAVQAQAAKANLQAQSQAPAAPQPQASAAPSTPPPAPSVHPQQPQYSAPSANPADFADDDDDLPF